MNGIPGQYSVFSSAEARPQHPMGFPFLVTHIGGHRPCTGSSRKRHARLTTRRIEKKKKEKENLTRVFSRRIPGHPRYMLVIFYGISIWTWGNLQPGVLRITLAEVPGYREKFLVAIKRTPLWEVDRRESNQIRLETGESDQIIG